MSMSIYDTMQFIQAKREHSMYGSACSMGAFLLAGGTQVSVTCFQTRVMIHQPLGGFKAKRLIFKFTRKESNDQAKS